MRTFKFSNWGVWARYHRRIYHHLDYFLYKALADSDGFLTMNEIRKLLEEETGFLFHPATLKKYNIRYAEENGMGPLCRFGDKYKLNRCLYGLKELKAPKIYKPRKKK
jgi:hypothetical protein